jgi:hypothetical protein
MSVVAPTTKSAPVVEALARRLALVFVKPLSDSLQNLLSEIRMDLQRAEFEPWILVEQRQRGVPGEGPLRFVNLVFLPVFGRPVFVIEQIVEGGLVCSHAEAPAARIFNAQERYVAAVNAGLDNDLAGFRRHRRARGV